VGGANSAGQAALNFARYAERVVILVRGESLSSTMSQYLIDQVRETPNIQLWTHASVAEAHGETHLEELSVMCSDTGKSSECRPAPCSSSLELCRGPIGWRM